MTATRDPADPADDPADATSSTARPVPADLARAVPCPACGAAPGVPCSWSPFRSWLPHPERIDAATDGP